MIQVLAPEEQMRYKNIEISDEAQVAIVNEANFFYDDGQKFPENHFVIMSENTDYKLYVIGMERSAVSTQYGTGELISVVQLVIADKPFATIVHHAEHNVKWGSGEPEYSIDDRYMSSQPMSVIKPILKIKQENLKDFIDSLRITH